MKNLTQLSVFLENKVGALAEICKTLASANVSLVALSLAEAQEFGIARLIVDDTATAIDALRAAKALVKTTPVTAIAVPDSPGGMSDVATRLSEAGCDIEYSYAFALQKATRAVLVFRFKDEARAADAVAAAGYATVGEDDLR